MAFNIKSLLLPAGALALLTFMILWLAGTFESKISPGLNPEGQRPSLDEFVVTPKKVLLYEDVAGSVRSRQSTDAAARILARINKIHVRAGDTVNRGDLLIELDSTAMAARAAQAKEKQNAAKALFERASSHYNRTRNLHARESATQVDLEQARAEFENAKSQLAATKEFIREAENILGYSRIRAAFKGRVIDRYAEPGDIATPGMKLVTLYDPNALRVDAYVRESLALRLGVGQQLKAWVDASGKSLTVTIEEVVPAADPQTRSFLVKTRVADDSELRPGMFARIRIPLDETTQIRIPTAYIRQIGQLDVVWLITDAGSERRFVRPGKPGGDGRIQIISGLSEGDRLAMPEQALNLP